LPAKPFPRFPALISRHRRDAVNISIFLRNEWEIIRRYLSDDLERSALETMERCDGGRANKGRQTEHGKNTRYYESSLALSGRIA
jgi:hypothetical protein